MDTSILGIDVSSRKLDLCWSNTESSEATIIAYTREALDEYLVQHKHIKPTTCTVGLESTGDYHISVARFFLKRGFTVRLINPIVTKYYTRLTIRGAKTDAKDAALICKLVADGQGAVISWADVADRDKELLRLARHLTKASAQLKTRLQSTKRKELTQMTKIELSVERLVKRIRKVSAMCVEAATVDRSAEEELIDTIPGFGVQLSAIVYHELGDIERFRNTKCLVAYAGLDPRIKQSGSKLNTTGRLTKRGSPMLRHALYVAANVARRFDPELNAYYVKKREEGRRHAEVLCIIARKLLYRIHAVLRERRPYVAAG